MSRGQQKRKKSTRVLDQRTHAKQEQLLHHDPVALAHGDVQGSVCVCLFGGQTDGD